MTVTDDPDMTAAELALTRYADDGRLEIDKSKPASLIIAPFRNARLAPWRA